MINTVLKNNKENKISIDNILNDIYLLPKWEKIKSFSLNKFRFFHREKHISVSLYRKFSSRNLLEKYSIKSETGEVFANMDLKVYKDSVYIINLDILSAIDFDKLIDCMLQTAIEKALYNTSEKKVVFNLTSDVRINNKIKKILINDEFVCPDNQSDYEKDMFGETFFIKPDTNSQWLKKIKQSPVLINK